MRLLFSEIGNQPLILVPAFGLDSNPIAKLGILPYENLYQMATGEPLDSERVHLLLPDPADQANYLQLLELYGN